MARPIRLDFEHRFQNGVEVRAHLKRSLEPGSVLVLFGPSGAGKTTVLRALAGLLTPARGRIAFGDRVWFDASSGQMEPPQARHVGYVSQNTALFPHLSARRNIEYGLRRMPQDERQRRTVNAATLVRAAEFLDRLPAALSGGQAQRVALARALAASPSLLLLDEPFGALDAELRRVLRADVRRIVRDTSTAAVLVTHDRVEAMAMGDDLAVMIDGRIQQVGVLADVFQHPINSSVARALGVETVQSAEIEDIVGGLATLRIGSTRLVAVADDVIRPGHSVFACIRAADVIVEARGAAGDSARNHLHGVVKLIEHEGAIDRVSIDCGFELVASITRQSRAELDLREGSAVVAAIKATAILVVPKA